MRKTAPKRTISTFKNQKIMGCPFETPGEGKPPPQTPLPSLFSATRPVPTFQYVDTPVRLKGRHRRGGKCPVPIKRVELTAKTAARIMRPSLYSSDEGAELSFALTQLFVAGGLVSSWSSDARDRPRQTTGLDARPQTLTSRHAVTTTAN